MTKNFNLLSMMLLLLVAFSASAQRKCGSAEHLQEMMANDPQMAINRHAIEQHTADYVANPSKHNRILVTIPVVFHIVYNTAAQNVSDAQIQSQLTVLNNDFRKLNSDVSLVPSAFAGLAADCEVQFCLAQQDPNGAATTGIVRKSTTVTSFGTNDAVKFTAQGGDNIWDRNKYLNIWVCNLGGGLLGYAQFPGGAASTDGVVVTYTGFGTIGTAAAPFNKGRTATHEVGHWLNLYHIWGDDGTACTGSDLVGDTPNQADENYGCPTFPAVSCTNGPNGDMFMNYMDYTDDACMYMFSAGQKARMQALFSAGGSRISLLTSPGCTPPSTSSCGVPGSLSAGSITSNSAVLTWGAVSGAVSYSVQYKLSSSSTWTTTTATTNALSLSGLTSGSTYNFQISAVCAAGSSAYSAASSFSTTAVCNNTYESNNTAASATTLALNTPVLSMIATTGDFDYYKITTTTAAPKVKVELTTLPADYDLRLYASNGSTQLASSLKAGTLSELIKYNTPTTGGTYYILVYGYNGAKSATNCYTLKASTSAANWRIDPNESMDEEKAELMLYPNPASDKLTVNYFTPVTSDVVASVYNAMGQKIVTHFGSAVEGSNEIAINTSTLAEGMYILEILLNGERKMEKFNVKK